MNYYGVGVKLGGGGKTPVDIFNECLENGIWYMGFPNGAKLNFEKLIENICVGDIVIAKAYATPSQRYYYVRGIGIVVNKKITNAAYADKQGFDVIWFKNFQTPIHLLAKNYKRGTFHTSTIFHETNTAMIAKIQEMMRYDYTGEPAEIISNEDYIEIAKQFVYNEAFDTYDNAEISRHLDPDIVAQDSFGRKIVRVPFVGNDVSQKGLILLVPEKDWRDDEISLCNMEIEFMNENADESEAIGKLKSLTDWDSQIDL